MAQVNLTKLVRTNIVSAQHTRQEPKLHHMKECLWSTHGTTCAAQ